MSEEGPKGEDFQRISRTFDIIKHLIASKHPRADQPLTDFFKRFVAQVITDWTTILGKDMNSELLRLEGIKAKFKLWQMCAEKGITYLKSVDQTLSDAFAEIFTQQALCLVASFELVKHAVTKSEEVWNQNKERDEELMKQRKEVEQVLAAAEEMEASVASIKQERDRYKAELDGIRSEVEGQILSLQTENERYFKQIVKLSKERAEASLNTPSSQIVTPKYMTTSINITQLFQGSAGKEFTLRQLKVLIEDVYESKSRSDEQNKELKQPLETLEQHLQSYLGQKYGLKVSNKWASTIIASMQRYEHEDAEVALFAKVFYNQILRNQIDEKFLDIIRELKRVVYKLTKTHIKIKNPYIREEALKKTMCEKVSGNLEEEEWKRIISYIYNESDTQLLHDKVHDLAFRTQVHLKIKNPKLCIFYKDFLNLLIEYQTMKYETYILPFIEQFKLVDSDMDGVLDEREFKELIVAIDVWEEAERLIEKFETHNLKHLTMTEIVAVLSNETVELDSGGKERVAILEKVCKDYK